MMKSGDFWIKKYVISFVAAGILTLAACGGNNDPELTASGQSAVEEELPAEKRYVYDLQEVTLGQGLLSEEDSVLTAACEKNGTGYFLENSRQTVTYGEKIEAVRVIEVPLNGVHVAKEVVLEGTTPEDDRIAAAKALSEEEASAYESFNLEQFQADEQGNFWAAFTYSYSSYTDEEHFSSFYCGYIRHWDASGKLLWESALGTEMETGSFRINGLVCTKEGGAVVLIGADSVGKYHVQQDGTVSELLSAGDYSDAFLNPYKVLYGPDGLLWILYQDSVTQGHYLTSYDMVSDQVGERSTLSDKLDWNHIEQIVVDENGNLVYSDSEGIYSYQVSQGTITRKMDFFNSDLDINGLEGLLLGKNNFLVSYRIRQDSGDIQDKSTSCGIGFLTKADGSQIPDKELIRIGGFYLDSDLKSRMISYNKEHQDSRMIFADYGEYDQISDGYAALKADLRSEEGPDILVVDSYAMELSELATEGLLAELDDLMKEDELVSANQYLDHVFDACKVNGKLYEVVPEFGIETYVGKMSLYQDKMTWTVEEMEALQEAAIQALSASDGASTELFLTDDYDFESFCTQLLRFDGRNFLDQDAGRCSFNSEDFIALLNYAKSQAEYLLEHTPQSTSWWNEYDSRYSKGRVLLENVTIGDPWDILSGKLQEKYGEAVGFPGLPTGSGCGSVIRTGTTYAIAEKSAHKDVAWEFLRFYLTEEYQQQVPLLPVLKKEWENRLEDCRQSDSLLEKETWETQKALLEKLVMAVDRRVLENMEMDAIFSRELEDFCSGKRRAADTAYIIQTRVNRHIGGLRE